MTPRSRGRGTILVVEVKEYRPQAWDGGWNGGPCEGVPTVHSLRRKTSHLIGMVLAWGRVGAGAGQGQGAEEHRQKSIVGQESIVRCDTAVRCLLVWYPGSICRVRELAEEALVYQGGRVLESAYG